MEACRDCRTNLPTLHAYYTVPRVGGRVRKKTDMFNILLLIFFVTMLFFDTDIGFHLNIYNLVSNTMGVHVLLSRS